MALYEVVVECVVRKLVIVEAVDEDDAQEKADLWDVIEESELELLDWQVEDVTLLGEDA